MSHTEPSPPAEATVRPRWRRDVALFLTGQTVSLFGSMLVQYAVMWYLTLTTKDGTVLALSTVFGFLPQAIVSVFGGVWADRHNRKWLSIGADAGIAAATLVLAVLMMSGHQNLWLIFAALAVRSTGAGIQTPAVAALVPQLVPTEHLLRINAINQSIQAGMALVCPAVAAILYANVPLPAIFLVDVVTAVIGIGLLMLVPVRTIRTASQAGYFADMVEGMRYLRGHRLIRWLLGFVGIVMVLIAAPSFLTPLMVARTFGDEVWKLTALELAFSIGMLLAGASIGVWGARFRRLWLLVGSIVALGVLSIAMGLATHLWVFLAFMFLVGAAVPAFSTPMMTVVQEAVEPERQGRVFGFWGIVSAVAMPLGMAIFGPLADVLSVQFVLIASGIATLLAIAVALTVPSGREAVRDSRDDAHAFGYGAGSVG